MKNIYNHYNYQFLSTKALPWVFCNISLGLGTNCSLNPLRPILFRCMSRTPLCCNLGYQSYWASLVGCLPSLMVNLHVNGHCRGDLKSNHVESDHIILHLSTITMLYNHSDAAGFIVIVEIIWLKFSFLLCSSTHWRI